MHPSNLTLEPLSDNANNLHTSGTPNDVDIEDSIEDSQEESLSSQATLDLLLYRDIDAHMQEPLLLREPSPVSE
jgi:hypothetical protein